MSRHQALRLSGELELQELQQRVGRGETSTEVPPLLERDIQGPVIQALNFHPRVAWAVRVNTGAMKVGERFVKFMFKGASDIWGQMKDGRLLVVETKRVGEKPTLEQQQFLDLVTENGGIGICVHSLAELYEKLPR